MKPFEIVYPKTIPEAVRQGQQRDSLFIAGGTTALDLMKYHVWQPSIVVTLESLSLKGIRLENNLLRIGAGETMSNVAYHSEVGQYFPMIKESLLLAASQGIRNAATIGGNLMQRTRCPYFRDTTYRCNQREAGAGCDAIGGWNRYHAILATSPQCIAAHASDLCVALAALQASVIVYGSSGERRIAFGDFYQLPGKNPEELYALKPGELILRIEVPYSEAARNSTYIKVRDRNSYAFAISSVAAGITLSTGTITEVKIGMGAVATIPWKAREAEKFLSGKAPTEENFREAARLATQGAQTTPTNAFKVPLIQNILLKALSKLT
jgi:xanthine dehydrogenase YagS FAD-binding subunit